MKTMFPVLLAAAFSPLAAAQQCFDVDIGTDLNLGDDATAVGLDLGFPFRFGGVDYTQICVSSNGYIWFGGTSDTGSDWTPTLLELREGAPRLAALWTDLNPAAANSGHVYYKAAPGYAVVSWSCVFEYGTQNPLDVQLVLRDNDHFDVVYGANPATGGSLARDAIIGASVGGGAAVAPVDFMHRPLLTGGDSFGQLFDLPATVPFANGRLNWSPTSPGYAVSDVPCTMNELPDPAVYQVVGIGCPRHTVSIYETFANNNGNPLDISGMQFWFEPNDVGGYVVWNQPPMRALPPRGTITSLPAGDDTTHLVTLPFPWPHWSGMITQIQVSSNGFVTLGPTAPGAGCCQGNAAAMLAGPPRIAAFWQDLVADPVGGLTTTSDPLAGMFSVDWNGVPEYGAPTSNTFRIVFWRTGDFAIELDRIDLVHATRVALIGYSDGGTADDPGAENLSALVKKDLGAHVAPLTMLPMPGTVPQLGTRFTTLVTNVPPVAHLVALMLGIETPPLDLGALGAPGCMGFLMMPPPRMDIWVTFGRDTAVMPVDIPASITLAGVEFMTQSACDDPAANPLGWRVSNGGRWTLGL